MSQPSEKKTPSLGNVKKVEQNLYAKNVKISQYKRYGFHQDEHESVQTDWEEHSSDTIDLVEKLKKEKKPMTVFTKMLITSFLFFIFSLGAAVMVYQLGLNQVKYDAVDLSVLGPNSVRGGEELSFDVIVNNNNTVEVVLADIIVKYPQGTVSKAGDALDRETRTIESITPGLSERFSFGGVLFGTEGEEKSIGISVEYRVANSNEIFFEDRVYEIALESAPVSLATEHKTEYSNGDSVQIDVEVISNAPAALSNLLVTVDYPFGFEFTSSTPRGIDKHSFAIGTLEPGEQRTISIAGVIRGQDNETRTVRYTLGAEDGVRTGTIGTIYTVTESSLVIRKPAIDLAVVVGGLDEEVVVVKADAEINVAIGYQNTLSAPLRDLAVQARLRGVAHDPREVNSAQGYYRSVDNVVIWEGADENSLFALEAGERGRDLSMSLKIKPGEDLRGVTVNPELRLDVEAVGQRFSEGGESQKVSTTISKKIKVETEPGIEAYLLYSDGPLENTGPVPARIGATTTYTLAVALINTTNHIRDGLVSIELPPYVTVRDIFEPQREQVDFDSRNRTVLWRPEHIEPGRGYTTESKMLYLSLAFEPSLSHKNRVPDIAHSIRFEGIDVFTNTRVEAQAGNVNAGLDRDSRHAFQDMSVLGR